MMVNYCLLSLTVVTHTSKLIINLLNYVMRSHACISCHIEYSLNFHQFCIRVIHIKLHTCIKIVHIHIINDYHSVQDTQVFSPMHLFLSITPTSKEKQF